MGHRRGGTARVGWRRSPSKDDAPAPAAALPCTQVRDAQLATLRADGEKAAAKEAQFYDNMRAQQCLEQDARVYRVRGWLCGTARGCGSVPAWCVGTGGGPSLPAALSGLRSTQCGLHCAARGEVSQERCSACFHPPLQKDDAQMTIAELRASKVAKEKMLRSSIREISVSHSFIDDPSVDEN